MPGATGDGVGMRIATARRTRRMTQNNLARAASLSLSMLQKIERGARMPGDDTLDAIAAALALDPSRLTADGRGRTDSKVRAALPEISAAIATFDFPGDGPVRPLRELQAAVDEAVNWRLGAQYVRIARHISQLLTELSRALHTMTGDQDRLAVAGLLVAAYRTADAVAFKHGGHDLSARLVDLMAWAAAEAEDPLLSAAAAYVRTETFFAARAHAAGLRALEMAIDAAPAPERPAAAAALGALHMRAAVIAGRAKNSAAATTHLAEARRLGDVVPEGVYQGTAFGPSSVRIHEVSVAVSLESEEHLKHALLLAREWKPPTTEVPAERRSGFYVELARAQLWSGLVDDAFETLKVARTIAPQHVAEHRWAREDTAKILRIKRASNESLLAFAEWIGAV